MAYNSIILRLELIHDQLTFGDVASTISRSGGDIVSIDVIRHSQESSVRDITVQVADTAEKQVIDSIKSLDGVQLINVSDRVFLVHLGGKISIQPNLPIKNRDDLSRVYTPGVARVCMAIHEQKDKAYSLTIKRNTVAVVTDGTAVLGLGDIGPHAAAPVMEGKAMLFKQLAGVDAFPICLDTKDTDELVSIIKAMSPIFGGINLEDISSPRCFEIEQRLSEELDIPVFHDDQHGTAIVVIAGLLNALKVVGKRIEHIRIVVNGIGAAGVSICKMLLAAGVKRLVPVDKEGAIVRGGSYPDHAMWQWLAQQPQVENQSGNLQEVLRGADVFIGVSRGGVLNANDVQTMSSDRIVFAMANPNPEIDPEEALPHVRVFATGRSDYPNQINNVLVFPGIFRGALDCRARTINEPMKLAASRAIASVVSERVNEQYIIPSIFNEQVVARVRNSVIEAAILTGTARRIPPDFR
ncbi:NAD-dependent malic enzyme [Paenibacillus andongensis]|uniref:NAD-dependent malic enzyme n=1 Tax=Paenibacillus andongensis TaxID=2975482 RepID=UPI0021BAE466|nr:NAD-dependent malic enzyme [Paenibacillus andongensis]